MKVAIVKYNAGNTTSVRHALNRLGVEPSVTDDADEILSADTVIFPGVGEASTAMRYLNERRLDDVIRSLKAPTLGICLGMQLMCKRSEENAAECLGIVPLEVKRFADSGLKVPHIGWNETRLSPSPLFRGLNETEYFYFVHGYFVEPAKIATAATEYGSLFTSAFSFENFHAVQFHPERSGDAGARVLKNFLNL